MFECVEGVVLCYLLVLIQLFCLVVVDVVCEQQCLCQVIDQMLVDFIVLIELVENKFYVDIVVIFVGYYILFDDDDLFDVVNDCLFIE